MYVNVLTLNNICMCQGYHISIHTFSTHERVVLVGDRLFNRTFG